MSIPTLSTIQASIIACAVLICCRNEMASKFVSTFYARNISMARRANIFDTINSPAYETCTTSEFDWKLWIKYESRKRIACLLFCQDMANCIFQGVSSPVFSPLDFHIELPCYEACWEAKTASECLQTLQRLPQQMRVSAAIRELRKSSVHSAALFEASGFGMFTLIKGLHCLLYHATQCDPDLFFNATGANLAGSVYTPHLNTQSLLYSLQQDLSGSAVTSLANEIVSLHNSITLKHVNNAFDAWHATWDMRHYRERGHEDHTFFNDPLPFWWLGKLYMILHCYSSLIPSSNEFAIWRVSGMDGRDKLRIQFKIRGWLNRFRKIQYQSETSTQSYLSKILRFSEHD